MNFVATISKFWQPFGYSNNTFDSKSIDEAEKNFPKIIPHCSKKDDCEIDTFVVLKKVSLKNVNRVLIGHINIISIRSKFDMLTSITKDKTEILMVSEKKLDSSFTNAQFAIAGYARPLRFDRNCHGGEILLFIREDIAAKMLSTASKIDFERFFVELNHQKKKFLLCC